MSKTKLTKSKTVFCDNEHCKLHEFEALPITEVLQDDYLSTYSRHQLKNGLHVCSICLNAITLSYRETNTSNSVDS